jgi:hypothetical protein
MSERPQQRSGTKYIMRGWETGGFETGPWSQHAATGGLTVTATGKTAGLPLHSGKKHRCSQLRRVRSMKTVTIAKPCPSSEFLRMRVRIIR